MADRYAKGHPSLEHDDMPSFLQNLIHGSSGSAADGVDSFGLLPRPGTDAADLMGQIGDGASPQQLDSSPCLNFSDPPALYRNQVNEIAANAFSPAGSSRMTEFYENKGRENSDAPGNRIQSRSSKRCRSLEDHNLSEKRRRSRINEKLKSLQTLIPNANRTDKASMLEEAIEYLKQLQLQVQVLTMRNGLSLYPGYFEESLQSGQFPQAGLEYDKGNAGVFSGHQEMLEQTNNHASIQNSTGQYTMPLMKNSITNLENPVVVETSIHDHHGLITQLASTKDLCRDDGTLSRLHLDTNFCGNISSPGISS
ncbi:unnamed protein product [Cuscuta epithymum]|uniref:BHLH domain-containing protein n=1 Tax=Cuscuta epithymum TaxID=186058 RepID=A0AAV0GA69_9ASTE|nr:unnamed protein product [Cuscuta epithymum]